VYAAIEVKQTVNAETIEYGCEKVGSVRALHRTSLPIPFAAGTYPARTPARIIGGIVALASDWSPALGRPMIEALSAAPPEGALDIGCVASEGLFLANAGVYSLAPQSQATTAFLLELIARLQTMATVPMIDIRAYAKWLGA
jgi:hypothetical protein